MAVMLVLVFQSCMRPHMRTTYGIDKKQVSFSSGKWLLDNIHVININTSPKVQQKMERLALESLQKCLGERVTFIDNARGKILLPNTAARELDEKELKSLKAATGFDHLIEISAVAVTKNQGIDNLTGYPPDATEMRIYIHIYDLETQKNIHYQLVAAYTNSFGEVLYETDEKIFIPALKKALKNLHKHSDCK
jgi:hypothetical protein